MSHLLHRPLLGPTVVHDAISCSFTSPTAQNLVVGRGTRLEVYSVRDASEYQESCANVEELSQHHRLNLVGRWDLYGVIEGLYSLRVPDQSTDVLLVCFQDAHFSVVGFDDSTHGLVTLGVHDLEPLRSGLSFQVVAPPRPIMQVDPRGRCVAFIAFSRFLAVYAVRPSRVTGVSQPSESKEDGEGFGGDAEENDVLRTPKGLIPAPRADPFGYMGSPLKLVTYVDLASVDVAHVRDAVFLNGYEQPTLVLLHEPRPTSGGRLAARYNTCELTGFSLSLKDQMTGFVRDVFVPKMRDLRKALRGRHGSSSAGGSLPHNESPHVLTSFADVAGNPNCDAMKGSYSVLSRLRELPHDSHCVYSPPLPFEGAIVISSAMLLVVHNQQIAHGVSFNEFGDPRESEELGVVLLGSMAAKRSRKFPIQETTFSAALDNARVCWLSVRPEGGSSSKKLVHKLLICTKYGELLMCPIVSQGSSVRLGFFSQLGHASPSMVLCPMTIPRIRAPAENFIFFGSRTGHSVLVSVRCVHTQKQEVEAGAADIKAPVEMDESITKDADFSELFGGGDEGGAGIGTETKTAVPSTPVAGNETVEFGDLFGSSAPPSAASPRKSLENAATPASPSKQPVKSKDALTPDTLVVADAANPMLQWWFRLQDRLLNVGPITDGCLSRLRRSDPDAVSAGLELSLEQWEGENEGYNPMPKHSQQSVCASYSWSQADARVVGCETVKQDRDKSRRRSEEEEKAARQQKDAARQEILARSNVGTTLLNEIIRRFSSKGLGVRACAGENEETSGKGNSELYRLLRLWVQSENQRMARKARVGLSVVCAGGGPLDGRLSLVHPGLNCPVSTRLPLSYPQVTGCWVLHVAADQPVYKYIRKLRSDAQRDAAPTTGASVTEDSKSLARGNKKRHKRRRGPQVSASSRRMVFLLMSVRSPGVAGSSRTVVLWVKRSAPVGVSGTDSGGTPGALRVLRARNTVRTRFTELDRSHFFLNGRTLVAGNVMLYGHPMVVQVHRQGVRLLDGSLRICEWAPPTQMIVAADLRMPFVLLLLDDNTICVLRCQQASTEDGHVRVVRMISPSGDMEPAGDVQQDSANQGLFLPNLPTLWTSIGHALLRTESASDTAIPSVCGQIYALSRGMTSTSNMLSWVATQTRSRSRDLRATGDVRNALVSWINQSTGTNVAGANRMLSCLRDGECPVRTRFWNAHSSDAATPFPEVLRALVAVCLSKFTEEVRTTDGTGPGGVGSSAVPALDIVSGDASGQDAFTDLFGSSSGVKDSAAFSSGTSATSGDTVSSSGICEDAEQAAREMAQVIADTPMGRLNSVIDRFSKASLWQLQLDCVRGRIDASSVGSSIPVALPAAAPSVGGTAAADDDLADILFGGDSSTAEQAVPMSTDNVAPATPSAPKLGSSARRDYVCAARNGWVEIYEQRDVEDRGDVEWQRVWSARGVGNGSEVLVPFCETQMLLVAEQLAARNAYIQDNWNAITQAHCRVGEEGETDESIRSVQDLTEKFLQNVGVLNNDSRSSIEPSNVPLSYKHSLHGDSGDPLRPCTNEFACLAIEKTRLKAASDTVSRSAGGNLPMPALVGADSDVVSVSVEPLESKTVSVEDGPETTPSTADPSTGISTSGAQDESQTIARVNVSSVAHLLGSGEASSQRQPRIVQCRLVTQLGSPFAPPVLLVYTDNNELLVYRGYTFYNRRLLAHLAAQLAMSHILVHTYHRAVGGDAKDASICKLGLDLLSRLAYMPLRFRKVPHSAPTRPLSTFNSSLPFTVDLDGTATSSSASDVGSTEAKDLVKMSALAETHRGLNVNFVPLVRNAGDVPLCEDSDRNAVYDQCSAVFVTGNTPLMIVGSRDNVRVLRYLGSEDAGGTWQGSEEYKGQTWAPGVSAMAPLTGSLRASYDGGVDGGFGVDYRSSQDVDLVYVDQRGLLCMSHLPSQIPYRFPSQLPNVAANDGDDAALASSKKVRTDPSNAGSAGPLVTSAFHEALRGFSLHYRWGARGCSVDDAIFCGNDPRVSLQDPKLISADNDGYAASVINAGPISAEQLQDNAASSFVLPYAWQFYRRELNKRIELAENFGMEMDGDDEPEPEPEKLPKGITVVVDKTPDPPLPLYNERSASHAPFNSPRYDGYRFSSPLQFAWCHPHSVSCDNDVPIAVMHQQQRVHSVQVHAPSNCWVVVVSVSTEVPSQEGDRIRAVPVTRPIYSVVFVRRSDSRVLAVWDRMHQDEIILTCKVCHFSDRDFVVIGTSNTQGEDFTCKGRVVLLTPELVEDGYVLEDQVIAESEKQAAEEDAKNEAEEQKKREQSGEAAPAEDSDMEGLTADGRLKQKLKPLTSYKFDRRRGCRRGPRGSVLQFHEYVQNERGPVSYVATLSGMLLVSWGHTIVLYSYDGSHLIGKGYHLAEFFIASLSVMGPFVLYADIVRGLSLLIWDSEMRQFVRLACDHGRMWSFACNFVSAPPHLGLLVSDREGNLVNFHYQPPDPTEVEGLVKSPATMTGVEKIRAAVREAGFIHLQRVCDVHLGTRVSCMLGVALQSYDQFDVVLDAMSGSRAPAGSGKLEGGERKHEVVVKTQTQVKVQAQRGRRHGPRGDGRGYHDGRYHGDRYGGGRGPMRPRGRWQPGPPPPAGGRGWHPQYPPRGGGGNFPPPPPPAPPTSSGEGERKVRSDQFAPPMSVYLRMAFKKMAQERTGLVAPTTDGSILTVQPISETVYRRLLLLSNVLCNLHALPAGQHPLRYRLARHNHVHGGGRSKKTIDGSLVDRFISSLSCLERAQCSQLTHVVVEQLLDNILQSWKDIDLA